MPRGRIALGRPRDALADGREADRAADAGRAGGAGGRQRGRRRVLGGARGRRRDRRARRRAALRGARAARAVPARDGRRASGPTARSPAATPSSTRCTARALRARLRSGSAWACTSASASGSSGRYGARAGEIAGELAMHFEHGRDFERAVRYRSQAAENALRQHGYREAAGPRDARARARSRRCPSRRSATQQELALHVMLGSALMALKGQAAPEVEQAYARARELCDAGRRHAPALPGPARPRLVLLVRGTLDAARDVGQRLRRWRRRPETRRSLLAAHNVLGMVAFYSRRVRGRARASRARDRALRSDRAQPDPVAGVSPHPGSGRVVRGPRRLGALDARVSGPGGGADARGARAGALDRASVLAGPRRPLRRRPSPRPPRARRRPRAGRGQCRGVG